MFLRKITTVTVAALATLTLLAPGAQALPGTPVADAHVAPWTQMGPQLEPASTLPGAIGISGVNTHASPKGTNTDCTPAPGENPIVLLHGMTSNAYASFGAIAPHLAAMDKCVFALDYGYYGSEIQGSSATQALPGFYGYAPLRESLAQITRQIAMVKERTGASKVDVVGWSAGGTLAAAYAKQEGAEGVGTVVSIDGVLRGTSMLGVASLVDQLRAAGVPMDDLIAVGLGPSGVDLLAGSAFMQQLNATELEVPGVRYVAISTRYDEQANPIEITQFRSGDFENHVLQDGCEQNLVDHLGTPYDARTWILVKNAFGANETLPCVTNVGPLAGLSS